MAGSSISSFFTSSVATIRQTLTANENDGDTVHDTHLCRVLRAYYTEKGRGFPGWLPHDPKAPPPTTPVYTSNVGAGYGGGMDRSAGGTVGGNKLGALWDNQGRAGAVEQPKSLRAGRPAASRPAPPPPKAEPRKMQSESATSVQNFTSAKDRLKYSAGHSTPTQSSAAPAARFSPPESGSGGKRSGSAPQQQAYTVSANAPWSSNEPTFVSGGYSDGAGGPPASQGLPYGPAAGRRGLPSGPRGYR